MLVKTSRNILILFVIFVLAIFVPDFYWKIFEKNIRAPFVLYSPVIHDFIISKFDDKTMVRMDNEGNLLTRDEYEELEPLFFYRQIVMTGKMPDSLDGMEIDIQELRRNNFSYRIKPDAIEEPFIQLYPLLESKSGRAKLEMPDEFIRLQNRCEFINCESNEVVEDLSETFSKAFTDIGFKFPAAKIFGNPTTRKPFDEGYFITDSAGDLFHLKRVKNKPYLKKVNRPNGVNVKYIVVTENERREFYAILVSEASKIYLISYNDYEFINTPIEDYDYRVHELMMRGNILYRSFTFSSDDMIRMVVTDREYNKIDQYDEEWISRENTSAGKFSKMVFPFTLSIIDAKEPFINFYFLFSDTRALIGIFISLIIAVILYLRKKIKLKFIWIDYIVILLTGIFGLIAVLLVRYEE